MVDGPSACFPGLCPEAGGDLLDVGGVLSEIDPGKNGGAGGLEDIGGDSGAMLILNGFPSFLQVRKEN